MDPTKLIEDLTWADSTIMENELKSVPEFQVRTLKHKFILSKNPIIMHFRSDRVTTNVQILPKQFFE